MTAEKKTAVGGARISTGVAFKLWILAAMLGAAVTACAVAQPPTMEAPASEAAVSSPETTGPAPKADAPENIAATPAAKSPGRMAKGVVYLDANQNGRRDADEEGLAGVPVSNGAGVVLTGAGGEWALPHDNETIFFVIKPAGHMTPTDKNNVPRFYYVHQPKGSPAQVKNYKGVAPTGPLPASIDFALHAAPDEPRNFEAIIMGDPQPRNRKEVKFLRDDVVAPLIGHPARFAVALGDIMFNDLSHFEFYNDVMRGLGMPVYNVPGNHDMNFDAAGDRYSLETWKATYGPPYYSFNYGDVHFVVLDNVEYRGRKDGRADYVGRFSEQQLKWLREDLKHVPRENLVVLMHHIPIGKPRDNAALRAANIKALFDVLDGRPHVLDLAGHTHSTEHYYQGRADGWTGRNPIHCMEVTAACGSWWGGPEDERGIPMTYQRDGTPNGWHIFRFEGATYSERFHGANLPESAQLRVSSPSGTITRDAVTSTPLVINIFNGGPRSRVEVWVDEEPVAVKRVRRPDPFFVEHLKRYKDVFSDSARAVDSSHVWEGTLPAGLKAGNHVVRVRTVDQYGQEFTGGGMFNIVPPQGN